MRRNFQRMQTSSQRYHHHYSPIHEYSNKTQSLSSNNTQAHLLLHRKLSIPCPNIQNSRPNPQRISPSVVQLIQKYPTSPKIPHTSTQLTILSPPAQPKPNINPSPTILTQLRQPNLNALTIASETG